MDRTKHIGGSDAAAILGISPWKSRLRLYLEKIGEYVEEVTPEKQRVFDRGVRWEPVVAEMVVDELRAVSNDDEPIAVIARNVRYLDAELEFIQAEIDLEIMLNGHATNVEIKTVHPFAAKEWGDAGTDEIPLHYLAQTMHGLMVTKRQTCIVAALIGVDDLRLHIVHRDDETIAAMRAKEIEFWRRVQERDPPDPETDEDVKWCFPKDYWTIAEADEELFRLWGELHYQKNIASHADDEIARIEQQIKLAMGTSKTLLFQGKNLCTWSSQESERIDVKRLRAERPDIAEEFTKTSASRVFRLAK